MDGFVPTPTPLNRGAVGVRLWVSCPRYGRVIKPKRVFGQPIRLFTPDSLGRSRKLRYGQFNEDDVCYWPW